MSLAAAVPATAPSRPQWQQPQVLRPLTPAFLLPSTRLTLPQLATLRSCPRVLQQVPRTCSRGSSGIVNRTSTAAIAPAGGTSTSTPGTARLLSRRHVGALSRRALPPCTASITQQQYTAGAPSTIATALTVDLPPRHSRAYRFQQRPLASAFATSPSRLHPLPCRLCRALLRSSPPAALTSPSRCRHRPSRHRHCLVSIRRRYARSPRSNSVNSSISTPRATSPF